MLFGIFLFHRGRKQIVLGVIVDHGFGQDLVLLVPFGPFQLFLHKSGDLIHI